MFSQSGITVWMAMELAKTALRCGCRKGLMAPTYSGLGRKGRAFVVFLLCSLFTTSALSRLGQPM